MTPQVVLDESRAYLHLYLLHMAPLRLSQRPLPELYKLSFALEKMAYTGLQFTEEGHLVLMVQRPPEVHRARNSFHLGALRHQPACG